MKSAATIRRHMKAVRQAIGTASPLEARALYIAEQTLLWALESKTERWNKDWCPVGIAHGQVFHIERVQREAAERLELIRNRYHRGGNR